jgi:hypothetical protein
MTSNCKPCCRRKLQIFAGCGRGRRALSAALGQDSEAVAIQHHGQDGRGELRAMIVIDIFKENHRFSN